MLEREPTCLRRQTLSSSRLTHRTPANISPYLNHRVLCIAKRKDGSMSYQPTSAELLAHHWFSRAPLTDKDSQSHVPFPLINQSGMWKCLCRMCAPTFDMREEEQMQEAYKKALVQTFDCLHHVRASRVA